MARAARVGAACPKGAIPWRRFFQSRASLAIFIAHASHNWCWYLLLSWLPVFLTSQGADLAHAGYLAVVPQLLAFTLSNAGAAIADRLLLGRLHISVTATRRIMGSIAHLGPAVSLTVLALTPAPGPILSTTLATLAIGLGACAHSAYWTNIMDVVPNHTGVLLGISNTIATLPGILCNLTTGMMLEPGGGGWPAVFATAAAIEYCGAALYVCLCSGEPQFDIHV